MEVGKLAAIAGAAAVAVTALGATAASASNGPAAAGVTAASASNGHPAAAATRGPTYINMHTGRTTQSAYFEPSNFVLLGGSRTSIFTKYDNWRSWGKYSAVGTAFMYGVRHGDRVYVGYVTMRFSDRKSDAHFIATGQQYSYFENVRISGIRPGNGGSVQNWHWSWHAHNWVT